jgi:WD40 repeat protein
MAPPKAPRRPTDFFISYSPADERWAAWIAWELEAAGYRTILQAWDFVPGTNFLDFMDRGVSEARAVIAVLSRNYLRSRYGRMEWQAALRSSPDNPSSRLITVRLEECSLEGLLATITYVDLVGVVDADQARALLRNRIDQALAGRAKPLERPGFPQDGPPALKTIPGEVVADRPVRHAPVTAPMFPAGPAAAAGSRRAVTVLHISGPRFGRSLVDTDEPVGAAELQARIWGDMTRFAAVDRPDLLVVTGNLTESGSLKETREALTFLTGLRALLGLEPGRLIVVPGARDVTRAACRAYFASCEADDITPQPPYWPKWRHFTGMFDELYQGLDDLVFDSSQPWTLFPLTDLKVVVAGLNSTMAESHREDDHYGWIGEAQAAWFTERMRPFESDGWLRIAAIQHSPVPGDPGALRDTGTFEALLAGHVNLALHGSAPGSGPGSAPGDGLPCLPALPPGQHQVVEITADGLTRWIRDGSEEAPQRVARQWSAVGATFTSGAVPAREPAAVEEAMPERSPAPATLLLDRIAEACATRFEGAKIRQIAADVPHLLVTNLEDGFIRQFRIGAHVGEVTEDDLEVFRQYVHADGSGHGSELVYVGPVPAPALREEALRRGIRLRSLTEFQGLLDLSAYVVKQTVEFGSSRLYPPDLYVPQRFRALDRPEQGIRDDLVREVLDLLATDHGRFILTLGDFGRGKTFALREIARRITTELPHLVPVLIELRALDKAHSVDGLVAAHLANHGEELIDLKAFHYMLRQGRIVLLFDGFDELVTRVTYDQAADHLDTLLQAAQDKAKIVLTSRTQHFKSHAQVFTALGEKVGLLPHRRVFGLEDFTPTQIRQYLVHRYGDEQAADTRLRLLSGIEDLLGLAENPRMLTFIADLPEERLRAVAQARSTVSAADLYREILGSWLAFEERRVRGVRGAPAGLAYEDLWRAVGFLAMRLWETNEQYLRPAELAEAAEVLTGLADAQLSTSQVAHAVGAGSLLIRTEEGLFGFIHGSVGEWLVARRIADDLGTDNPGALGHRRLSQLTVDFLCDLADAGACQAWATRVLADPVADDVARDNAIKITTRLRIPARTDLRGANLAGQDLSYRDLQEVDLTEADLTDARLVGANLSRAVMRDAVLTGARLDEAQLPGADLRGADLTRARLARTDLRDVSVAGSHWSRAALIDVVGAGRLAALPELHGAAIVPGRPVELQLAPHAVGVPYGFHFQTSRLPEPLCYSPDGTVLAIGGEDGGVLVCSSSTGRPLRTLAGHRDRTYAVTYGPQGLLATGSADGTVRLWDTATGECLHVLRVHPDGAWPVVLSPDGSSLITGSADGVLRVWSVRTGEGRAALPGHTAPIYTAVYGPDGTILVTGDAGARIRIWDLATGTLQRTLIGPASAVYRIVFSPDGSLLAAGDANGIVRLWDAGSWEIRQELTGHTGRVYALAFHPDGRLLATGDTDGNLRLWDLGPGYGRRNLAGHTGAVYQATFSPDGSVLGTGDSDGVVRLWDTATGQQRQELLGHRGSVWPFVFHPDGAALATSSNDGSVRLWDTETGQNRHVLRGHGRRITSLSFSPGGTMLASCGNDGAVRLWEPRTGRQLNELTGLADRLTSAIFNPAGAQLATASNDGGVYLWQAGTGAFERELNVETDHIWAEAFSPDGRILATANDDDTVRLWYRAGGRQVANLADHRGRVRSIDFSPDGGLVATGCDDHTVRIWSVAEGECHRTLAGHTDRVYRAVFAPRGDVLASASNDGTARLWNPHTGEPLHTLTGHTGRLWTVAFSPDGTLLATAGDDRAVRLWDPGTGDPLYTLTGHARRIWAVAFSPDGTLLASAGDDGTIILWNLAGETPVRYVTLLGLAEGWAALSPDGRYKTEGEVAGQFWYAAGMCRFEPGELDPYLSAARRLSLDAEF